MAEPSILMIAGERSGDVYGAALAKALRARLGEIPIFGCGGDAMREAGVETLVDAHAISMVGIVEIASGLPRVRRAFKLLVEESRRRKPKLAVLIDFPDFNLRVAKQLKRSKTRVVYFVSPQIWAWRRGRIKQIKACVDKMLCIFDFEEAIYKDAGIPVEYVGHPLIDLVRPHLTREQFFAKASLDPKITTVALLPGSRKKEVFFNLPTMLDCASRLALDRKIQFMVAVAPSLDPLWLEARFVECFVGRATVQQVVHLTYDALQHSDVAIVASGTATLEAALRERPMVVVYRVSPLSWLVGKMLVKVPFYSMVNLLAGKLVVKELIQHDFKTEALVKEVERLLDDAVARDAMVEEFRALRPRLGSGGAIERAADAVVGVLEAPRKTHQLA